MESITHLATLVVDGVTVTVERDEAVGGDGERSTLVRVRAGEDHVNLYGERFASVAVNGEEVTADPQRLAVLARVAAAVRDDGTFDPVTDVGVPTEDSSTLLGCPGCGDVWFGLVDHVDGVEVDGGAICLAGDGTLAALSARLVCLSCDLVVGRDDLVLVDPRSSRGRAPDLTLLRGGG